MIKYILFFIFFCFIINNSYVYCNNKELSIDVICVPTHGHFGPMLTFIEEIRNKGHYVRFYSASYIEHKVIDKVDKFYSLGNATTDSLIERALGSNKEELGLFDISLVFKEIEYEMIIHLIPIYKELAKNNNLPDIIIADFLTFGGFDIADLYNIPYVITTPGNLGHPFYSPLWYPGSEEGLSLIRRFKGMGLKLISNFLLYSFYSNSNQVRNEFNIKPWKSFDSSLFTNKINFQFAFLPLFEPGPSVLGPIQLLGLPFKPKDNIKLEDNITNWINKHNNKPIIYVSFGTMAKPSKEFLKYLTNQLISCTEYNFIWSLRDEFIQKNNHISQLININSNEHILRVNWVDQASLLSKIDIFFTHGGYNSMIESIYNAKPMLCMPFMAEQPENCARIKQLQVGLVADKDNFDNNLCLLFKELLTNNIYKEQAIMLSDYSKVSNKNSLSKGVEILELIHKHGDQVLLPLDFDAGFFQRFNWDLFIIHSIILFLLGVFFTYCCCGFCKRKNTIKKKID